MFIHRACFVFALIIITHIQSTMQQQKPEALSDMIVFDINVLHLNNKLSIHSYHSLFHI